MKNKYTIAEAKQLIRDMGVGVKYSSELEEYAIWPMWLPSTRREAATCYTTDQQDAIGTANVMRLERLKYLERKAKSKGPSYQLLSELYRLRAHGQTCLDCGGPCSDSPNYNNGVMVIHPLLSYTHCISNYTAWQSDVIITGVDQ